MKQTACLLVITKNHQKHAIHPKPKSIRYALINIRSEMHFDHFNN